MNACDARCDIDAANVGVQMHDLVRALYPICRSITGEGVRATLAHVSRYMPLSIQEVPTGTQVFDWTVPREWNVRDAYVRNDRGEKVVDFAESNLHLLNYSVPVDARVPLSELRNHLYSLPEHPDWIPYRTSYYRENWGFCLRHHQLTSLQDGEYEVLIDASLEDGHLTYAEYLLPGETTEEILFSCHICHPSLCNDNLSGIALCVFLAKRLAQERQLRYSYRFLFIPGTIGAITWLAGNEAAARRIAHGLVVACVGDRGSLTYKKSRRGNAEIDRVVAHVLKCSGDAYEVVEFSPYGYDERQYCSPGFDLPVGSLTRTPHGQYPEYHTSADNVDFVDPGALADSLDKYLAVVNALEHNRTYINLNPHCEPQLGKRGLYSQIGGQVHTREREMALLWVLNLSDGTASLLDIAERAGLPFPVIRAAAADLLGVGLLAECGSRDNSTPSDSSSRPPREQA